MVKHGVCSWERSVCLLAAAAEWWCGRLGWMMSGLKKLSHNDSFTSWVYESGCLCGEWCALLLLHLKCFTANMYVKAAINQTWQPCNLSVPAGRVNTGSYKRHKHISTLINAIKWSNDFSGATSHAVCAGLHRAHCHWPANWGALNNQACVYQTANTERSFTFTHKLINTNY